MTTTLPKSNQRRAANSVGSIVIGGLVGAALGFGIVSGAETLDWPVIQALSNITPWLLALITVGCMFLTLLIHELGHLAAGMLNGMRPLLLVVGPLRVQREGQQMRISLNRSLALAGGLAASVPQNSTNLRRRMAWTIAGGPIASLLLLFIGAALAAWQSSVIGAIGLITASLSGLICLVTLIPMRSSGFNSDGARLVMLSRGGPTVDRYLANLALVSSSLGGIRPQDWDPSLVQRAQAVPDDTIDHYSAQLMAYSHLLDRGEIQQAGAILDGILENLDGWPKPFQAGLQLEGAYFAARHRHQPLEARQLLNQAGNKGILVAASTRLSAEAAVLLAEGNNKEAVARAKQGLLALDRATDAGSAIVERERMEATIAAASAIIE